AIARLQHDHRAAAGGERARGGQAGEAGADDDDVGRAHDGLPGTSTIRPTTPFCASRACASRAAESGRRSAMIGRSLPAAAHARTSDNSARVADEEPHTAISRTIK